MYREIIVALTQVGFHRWADAPDEVAFLRNVHRHLFHIKIGIPVAHGDRQREFFIERDRLRRHLTLHNWNDAGSCESICEFILQQLPHVVWAEVFEDGENGARVYREIPAPGIERTGL